MFVLLKMQPNTDSAIVGDVCLHAHNALHDGTIVAFVANYSNSGWHFGPKTFQNTTLVNPIRQSLRHIARNPKILPLLQK